MDPGHPTVAEDFHPIEPIGRHALRCEKRGLEGGDCAVVPDQLRKGQVAGSIGRAVHLGAIVSRLGTIHQREDAVEIVDHGEMKGRLTGKGGHRRNGTVADTADVRNRAATPGFLLQLEKLAVEEQDVPEHQVGGIGRNEGRERPGVCQVFCDRLLQEHGPSR